MKKIKQFIAVFMTAVFLAGTCPLTLSAADTRGDASVISVQSNTETGEDAGKQAEPETYGEKPAMQAAQAVYTVTLNANGGRYWDLYVPAVI